MPQPLRLLPAPDHEPQADSIAEAKLQQAIDRAMFTATTGTAVDDDGRVALQIANAIVAAVYGPRGERR